MAKALEIDLARFRQARRLVRMPAVLEELAETLTRVAALLREAAEQEQAVDLGDEVVRLIEQFRGALRAVGGDPPRPDRRRAARSGGSRAQRERAAASSAARRSAVATSSRPSPSATSAARRCSSAASRRTRGIAVREPRRRPQRGEQPHPIVGAWRAARSRRGSPRAPRRPVPRARRAARG